MSEPSEDIPEATPVIDYRTNPAHAKYWWEGQRMAVIDGANLCGRCIRCGSEENLTRHNRTLGAIPVWLIFLWLLLFWPVAVIFALRGLRRLHITYELCSNHRRAFWRRFAWTAIGLPLSFGAVIWGVAARIDGVFILGILGCIAGAFVASAWVPTIYIVRCRGDAALLRGVWSSFPADIYQAPEEAL